MRAQIQNLYARYERAHLRLFGHGQAITDVTGTAVGHVERVTLEGGSLRVIGWVRARKMAMLLAGLRAEAVPDLRRDDVSDAWGGPAKVGFDLTIPGDRAVIAASTAPELVFEAGDGAPAIRPVSLPIPVPLSAVLLVRAGFLRDGLRALPCAVRWLLTRDPVWRGLVKTRLRLTGRRPGSGPLSPGLFAPAPVRAIVPQRVTIVLPVHNAFEVLRECLVRVLSHTDLPWRMIVVEDCSTDPRVRPLLREWAAGHAEVELVENDENLGFIGSVNLGLARAMQATGPDEGPVVLLNSDALVPQGWASRLIRPLQERPEIASVTPMSNDAEILSAPVICQRTALAPGQGDAIDAVARRLSPDAVLPALPTGVGFCMAMARPWLARVGTLDTAFGRGYGEEVDWCRRAARMGGVHVALPGLFVEHRGGESFGQEEKRARVARAGRIISQRYPDFDASVQRFIAADPLRTARLALGLAWAGSVHPEAVPVYLAHSMGGGADLYLEERIAADLARDRPSVVLRVGGPRRWGIELVTPMGRSHGECDDTGLVRDLLACLPRRQVVYSCGVGDPDPVEIPALLLSLLGPEDSAQMLFHDYLPLSPSHTLLGSDGIYRGPVRAPDPDPAHTARRPDGSPVPLGAWQAAWKALAQRAEIVAFSADSARHVASVWPDLAGRIVIRPHALRQPVPALLPVPDRPVVIGVLGNIGPQKGAVVLQDLAARLAGREAGPGLVLIGNIDPAHVLPRTVPVHGDYNLADLPALAERYRITHWLIPSVWPETFSYTLHEALATRLPVLAFDIGAQGDAVRAAPNGIAVPFADGHDLAARILSALDTPATTPAATRCRFV